MKARILPSPPSLPRRRKETQEFLASYATSCADSRLSLNVQHMLCEVLWRISKGIAANDETSECAKVTDEFEKRVVTKKGGRRMGILDWWQHDEGCAARIAACSERNRCGIKRTQSAISLGASMRCPRCDRA